MISAILDTNIIVQGLIGSPRSAAARCLDSCLEGRFRLVYSSDASDELLDVLVLPQIQDRHGLTDAEIVEFVGSLVANAILFPGVV